MGFRYQLRLSEGDDVGECEWGYHPQAGDDIRADGNVRYNESPWFSVTGLPNSGNEGRADRRFNRRSALIRPAAPCGGIPTRAATSKLVLQQLEDQA